MCVLEYKHFYSNGYYQQVLCKYCMCCQIYMVFSIPLDTYNTAIISYGFTVCLIHGCHITYGVELDLPLLSMSVSSDLKNYHIKIVDIFSQWHLLGVYHFYRRTGFTMLVITIGITVHDKSLSALNLHPVLLHVCFIV